MAAIGTLFFFTADESIPWFVAFLGLTVISGLLEPIVSQHAAAILDAVGIAFFVLNVTGVSLTAYLMLQFAVRARDEALARSEELLLNVLPKAIAERLKREPGVIAEAHEEVTVLFADVVDFTPLTERMEPARVVELLDEVFSAFDALAARHGLEKIKTIGDAYWGDTVNTASRMESRGLPGHVQVSEATHRRLSGRYAFVDRGEIDGHVRRPA